MHLARGLLAAAGILFIALACTSGGGGDSTPMEPSPTATSLPPTATPTSIPTPVTGTTPISISAPTVVPTAAATPTATATTRPGATPTPTPTLIPSPTPIARTVIAQLAVKEGTGEYRVSGLSNWLAASGNVSLAVGDSIRTPSASRASVTFSDGSVIVLEPSTEVQVQNYRVTWEGEAVRTRTARIALVRGKITADVREDLVYPPSVFEIATASEVITIRGTLKE